MAFTITDPRRQAYSQAAGNFGSGLGEALNQYVNNKIYQNAIQGLGPEATVQDTLNAFTQHNVPMEYQRQHFSPALEAARQRERTGGSVQNLINKDWSGSSDKDIVLQATNALKENPQLLGTILPTLLESARRNRHMQAQGGNQPLHESSMKPATNQLGQSSEGYSPFYESGIEQGIGETQQAAGNDIFKSIQPQQQQAYPNEGFQDVDRRDQTTNQLINQGWNVNDAIAEADRREAIRERQIAQEKLQTEALDEKLKEKYGTGPESELSLHPDLRNLAVALNRYEKGTDEQKFNKTARKLDNILDAYRGTIDSDKLNWWEFWKRGDTDKMYEKLANGVDKAIKETGVPEDLRPNMLNLAQEMLAKRPDLKALGVQEVMQRLVNRDKYKKEMALLSKVPQGTNAYQESAKRGAKFTAEKDIEQSQKKLDKARPEVTRRLAHILQSNPYSSPLLLKEQLIEKGYEDDFIISIFDEIYRSGWEPSQYQKPQLSQLRMRQNQTLGGAWQGQKALRGLDELITGIR